MKSIIAFLTSVICLAFASVSMGNTGVFYGSGNQIIPIKNDKVRMVREYVNIKLSIEENNGRFGVPFIPWANVTATFYLQNTTQSDVSLQAGFPFLDLQGFGKEKEVLDKLNFKVVSNGIEVKTELKQGLIEHKFDPRGLFKKVFAWKEEFKPSERKTIIVTYRMLMSVGSAHANYRGNDEQGRQYDDIDRLIFALNYIFGYITQTAYTWAWKIEEAIFEIDCTAFYKELAKQNFLKNMGKHAPNLSRPIYLEYALPNGAQKHGSVYRWQFTGQVPNEGISIGFIVLFLPSLPAEVKQYYSSILLRLGDIKPDDFKSIIQAYYQIIAFNKQPIESFPKNYFKDIALMRMPKIIIFQSDEKNIKEIANKFQKLID